MKLMTFLKVAVAAVVVWSVVIAPASAASVAERRDSIRQMSQETLVKLYKVHPTAQSAVENAVGYAVFSISDVKLIFLGGGGGKGLAVNNRTGRETFMKTGDVQVGLGLGIKKFYTIFVFESDKAFSDFANNGWQLGGQATAAATDSVSGGSLEGAVSVGPDTWMYQMTDKGLELSLTVRGIRYYKDSELN